MVIISDCLINKTDEGSIKVASSLAKRLQKAGKAFLISDVESDFADKCISANKLFSNREVYDAISEGDGPVLYIPFSSNSKGGILRTFFLARKSKRAVYSLFALRHPMPFFLRLVLKLSGARIVVLSKESYDYYNDLFKGNVLYLKTGIDTTRFVPASSQERSEIRKKYGYDDNDRIVLHVGHLKKGRNVDKLLEISEEYKVLILVSSVTVKDEELEKEFRKRANVQIIDTFVPDVQEVYQMADAYIFPVEEESNCIDVPLSVLEAASCNLPVICTRYGELKEFEGKEGFCYIQGVNGEKLNSALQKVIGLKCNNREAVLDYDWNNAVEILGKLT